MAVATDPFLERATDHISRFSMDTLDEVRWPPASVVQLIDQANALVFEEVQGASPPKHPFRITETDVSLTIKVDEYLYPGNMRKFLRMINRDANGNITKEIIPTDPMSDLSGIALYDHRRGYRLKPVPTATETGWAIQYIPKALPFLCYGTASAGAAATITLAVPSSTQLGSLSLDDSFYNNSYIRIVSGTGNGQVRRVTAYVGSTKVATVGTDWDTNPDSTSVFEILPAIDPPLDVAIMWRVTMTVKAADADRRHYQTAEREYSRIMRLVLSQYADVQGRMGESLSDDYLSAESYGLHPEG